MVQGEILNAKCCTSEQPVMKSIRSCYDTRGITKNLLLGWSGQVSQGKGSIVRETKRDCWRVAPWTRWSGKPMSQHPIFFHLAQEWPASKKNLINPQTSKEKLNMPAKFGSAISHNLQQQSFVWRLLHFHVFVPWKTSQPSFLTPCPTKISSHDNAVPCQRCHAASEGADSADCIGRVRCGFR